MTEDNEEKLLRSVALQTSYAILRARHHVEHELTQAKKSLEEKTRRLDHSLSILRGTMESTTDGILVTDQEGVVLRFNERYLRMWPIPRDVTNLSDHGQLLKYCGKSLKDPQQFLDRTAQIYASWPADSYDLLELADGRVFERFSKIQHIEGQDIGRIWNFRDVTARKHAEDAVRESSERLRFMAEAMPHKIFTARADGVVDYFNQQWRDYTGFTLEQLGEWDGTKLVHPDDVDEHNKRWRHALATGEPFQMEYRVRRIDGDYRWHMTQVHAKRDAQGKISMWVGSSTDIDTLKRANEEKKQLLENERIARSEAERVNRIKDEFLATLSHELRTPLNAILGWSQLILQATMSKEDVRRGLETIERNARAQNKLIADLLEMSSVISGKIRLDVERLDLAAVAEAAIESIAPAAKAKHIRLRKIIDRSAGPVWGDPNRLPQIIWNLLSNAVKFTPKSGNIEVIVKRAASHLEVTVKDSGMGIVPEFLTHVFDRFRQADSSITRNHGGLGLGLAIVKQLVELHGGTVRAESAGEGKGASFIVSLPAAPPLSRSLTRSTGDRSNPSRAVASGHRAASPSPSSEGEHIALSGVRVLVVDDQPDSCELIGEILTQYDAGVITAGGAAEGLENLKNHRPDVMISDIGMPDKNGYELIREVRSLPASHGGTTPAIALTAFARSGDRARALTAGYQMHLSKPVESRELVAAIASLTRRKRKPAM